MLHESNDNDFFLLTADEGFHHKNGLRFDNRPENLEVMSNAEDTRIYHKEVNRRLRKPVDHDQLCPKCSSRHVARDRMTLPLHENKQAFKCYDCNKK